MNQYICKIYVVILFAVTDIAQRSETRCTNIAINRCRNSIPGPSGVFSYRMCETTSSFQYRCIYRCNAQNCNKYCISYGNGFNSGNCEHDVIIKRTTCLCTQNGSRGSNNTTPKQPSNGGQSGQRPPPNGQSGQGSPNGQSGQGPPNGGQSGQGGAPNGQPGQGPPNGQSGQSPPNGGQPGQGPPSGQSGQGGSQNGQQGQGPPNGQSGQGKTPPPPQDHGGQEQDTSRDASN